MTLPISLIEVALTSAIVAFTFGFNFGFSHLFWQNFSITEISNNSFCQVLLAILIKNRS
jgi:hypothetical protein